MLKCALKRKKPLDFIPTIKMYSSNRNMDCFRCIQTMTSLRILISRLLSCTTSKKWRSVSKMATCPAYNSSLTTTLAEMFSMARWGLTRLAEFTKKSTRVKKSKSPRATTYRVLPLPEKIKCSIIFALNWATDLNTSSEHHKNLPPSRKTSYLLTAKLVWLEFMVYTALIFRGRVKKI